MPATPLRTARFLTISLLALYLALPATLLQAQMRWMSVGALQSPYSALGAVMEALPFDNAALQWPAIDMEAGNSRAQGLWIGVKDYTDEDGQTFPVKVAHVGPRGVQIQFFPKTLEVIGRSDLNPAPKVTVDGEESYLRFVEVDKFETMKPDRMIHNVSTTRVGVDVEQKVYAFSQEFHDNYHIIEYTFTNTGIVDPEQTIELDQTLEGIYFFLINHYAVNASSSWVRGNGAPWGKFTMNDAVGDGHEDYEVDFRAQFAWCGLNPDQKDFNTLGGSLWNATTGQGGSGTWYAASDTVGRLAAAHMVGRVTIHADKSVTDRSDDPGQPSTMGVMGQDDPDRVELEYDVALMQRQYEWMSGVKSASFSQQDPLGGEPDGRLWPHQANQVEPDDDGGYTLRENFVTPTNNPAFFPAQGRFDEGGWSIIEGYGPYTLAKGEHINLVVAEGVAGLSDSAKLMIGIQYKATGAPPDETALLEWRGVSMTKNEWVLTSRDSLFDMFERAIANYESDYSIPQPPLPPKTFTVTSSPDAITLDWEMYGTGPAVTGFEIWRVSKRYTNATGYVKIATLASSASSYYDVDVIRGIGYYYYIQAVGAVNTNSAGLTPTGVPLKSGRYYAQTYNPAWVNTPPVAVDDSATTISNRVVTINVLVNDTDPHGDPLSIWSIEPSANSGAAIGAGDTTLSYVSIPGFTGTDTLIYVVTDGHNGFDTALVMVTVTDDPHDPPIRWLRTYGGSDRDYGTSVQQTADNGYIITGHSRPGPENYYDIWLLKTDVSGDTVWTRTFGGTSNDYGESVHQTIDGGYIITGYTASYGAGGWDIWLLKTDASGDTVWTRTFGGTSGDYGQSVQQTADGGYIIAGYTNSYGEGSSDILLIKTDSVGDTVWTRTFGGAEGDYGYSVQQTADDGYIITGYTASFGAGSDDVLLIKTDTAGDTVWTRTFGGTGIDYGYSVQQTADDGYIVTGYTASYGAGGWDIWLLKTDASGDTVWTRTFGGTGSDHGYSVQQTADGGYIIAGTTASSVPGSAAWLIKTDALGDTVWTRTIGGVGGDAGLAVQETTDGGYIIGGNTTTFGAGESDVWLIKVGGEVVPVSIGDQADLVPQQFALHQNYPNPFNPNTIVQYSLPIATEVKLVVYDLLGREVARLVDDYREAGYHRIVWNGRDARGRDLPTGLYIARMVTPQYAKSIKMLLLK